MTELYPTAAEYIFFLKHTWDILQNRPYVRKQNKSQKKKIEIRKNISVNQTKWNWKLIIENKNINK